MNKAGKALLIVAGAVWGFRKGLGTQEREVPRRLDEGAAQPIRPTKSARSADFVTHEEMTDLLTRCEARMNAGIAQRFEAQSAAIRSLRAMVGQTDQLLDRVLRNLEAAREETGQRQGVA